MRYESAAEVFEALFVNTFAHAAPILAAAFLFGVFVSLKDLYVAASAAATMFIFYMLHTEPKGALALARSKVVPFLIALAVGWFIVMDLASPESLLLKRKFSSSANSVKLPPAPSCYPCSDWRE